MLKLAALTAALAALVALPAGAAAQPAEAPVRLTFEKALVEPGVWRGEVGGDLSGSVETRLLDVRAAGPILHITFDWIVDAGEHSFVARLSGTLNTRTGAVGMNGRVTDGFLAGAQVHEEGQLVDSETLAFEGSIRLMPATARR